MSSTRCAGLSVVVRAGHGWLWLAMVGQGRPWLVTAHHAFSVGVRAGHGWLWLAMVGQGMAGHCSLCDPLARVVF